MRLLADNMLGKLAKWLRFMGYDVEYPKSIDDKSLIKLTREEKRILLTRDKELAKVKNLDVIYINSEKIEEQLKQLIKDLNLIPTNQEFTRCPECNNLISEIDKSQVEDKVPEGVFKRQDEFWFCNNCGRYYWQGTHYIKIKDKIEKLYQ